MKLVHCLKCTMENIQTSSGEILPNNLAYDIRKKFFEEYCKEDNPIINCETCHRKVSYTIGERGLVIPEFRGEKC